MTTSHASFALRVLDVFARADLRPVRGMDRHSRFRDFPLTLRRTSMNYFNPHTDADGTELEVHALAPAVKA